MDPLKLINDKIIKEKACIDDLIKEIAMHTQNGRYQLASNRGHEMQKTINRIQQLEGQKELHLLALKYVGKGINAEVVPRHVQV